MVWYTSLATAPPLAVVLWSVLTLLVVEGNGRDVFVTDIIFCATDE